MLEDSLLEEDIWEYKSVKKFKAASQYSEAISKNVQKTNDEKGESQRSGDREPSKGKKTSKTRQHSRQRENKTPLKPEQCCSISSDDPIVSSQESLSSSSAKQKKKKQTPSKQRPIYEGYCPCCQMPFSLLLIETPQWHVTECLEGSKPAEKECPDGLLCSSAIPSHYKRYSHFLLATSRAGEYLPEFTPANTDNNFFNPGVNPSINCSAYSSGVSQDLIDSQNLRKSSQQSSTAANATNVTNKKTYCLENTQASEHRIHGVNDVEQFGSQSPLKDAKSQQDSYQLNTFISENKLSGCDISYSPLNTDEEDSTTEEEEDVVAKEETQVVAEIKHFKKKLFSIRNSDDKHGQAGSFLFKKPLGASEPNQFEPSGVKTCTINSKSRKTLKTIVNVAGISNHVSLDTATRRVFSLTNILDTLKDSSENQAFPSECKSTEEKLQLNSSSLNAGESGWSNTHDYNRGHTDSGAVFSFMSSGSKESVAPFLPGPSDMLKKPRSCLNSEDKTTTGACKNKLAYNNSCLLTEKEGAYNNAAVPVTCSPVSKMLPYVSEANTGVQRTPAKELKQMDIGVFFGLPPKSKLESEQKKTLESTQNLSPSAVTGTRPRSQKRKAKESLEDSDVVTESSSTNNMPVELPASRQGRWRKRFKESCIPGEEGTKKKLCPFYKKIPGTGFVVDAFQYGEIEGCVAYFLTHFHSDHYGGLTKKFTFPIYCNKNFLHQQEDNREIHYWHIGKRFLSLILKYYMITGNLVKYKLRVPEQYVHILPMNSECIVNGIKVVLLDANHCPGAAMILFSLPNGTVILHTGDFRADPSMERYPFLGDQKVHTLYLDTTYCNPEYTFPSQQEVIQFAVNTAFETVTLNPRTLVVCGTYSVGKEKVFLAIADVLGSKVSMAQEKYKTLQCLESTVINSLITLDWNNTFLHLLPMMQINFRNLQSHLNKFCEKFDQILAFKPTGWTYSEGCCSLSDIQPQTRGKITIYGIPYSEHSSFLEMKRFVQWLKPQKIIPTVNVGTWKSRNEMEKHFRNWKMEVTGWN